MAKTRQQKEVALERIEKQLNHKSIVLMSYMGLKVTDLEDLRKKLRVENSTLTVAKRNLFLLALKNRGIAMNAEEMKGSVAMAVGDDEVMPAKVVADFRKTHENVQLFGGIVNEEVMDVTQVTALATLPSKPELLAKLVGTLNAPVSGFVNVLAGNLRGLVNVLNAVKSSKE